MGQLLISIYFLFFMDCSIQDTERKENGTATTLEELADYGRGLIHEGDDDNRYIIVGIENKVVIFFFNVHSIIFFI